MRPIFIFALFALACLPFAEGYSTSSPEYAVYVPNNASFSVENFTTGGSYAYAVVSGGTVYAMFTPGLLGMEPVADSKKIEPLLQDYYVAIGLSPSAVDRFDAVHQGIRSISSAYMQGVTDCRELTNTQNSPCDSFESCRTACLGTPFCPNFAAGGAPGEFIYVLLEFENSTTALANAYALENSTYGIFKANKSLGNMAVYLASLEKINRAAGSASQSRLFTEYSYCFTPDYSLPEITNLQLSAQKYYNSASPFFSITAEAEKIRERTEDGIERKNQQPPAPPVQQNNSNSSNSTQPPAGQMANSSNSTMAPAAASPMPLGAIAIGGVLLLVLLVGAGAFFYLKSTKRGL
ncbi:Uncharacterised protein [uncultured archaeon]|nr:Uncharacterised protein [uncultured archaeon]